MIETLTDGINALNFFLMSIKLKLIPTNLSLSNPRLSSPRPFPVPKKAASPIVSLNKGKQKQQRPQIFVQLSN